MLSLYTRNALHCDFKTEKKMPNSAKKHFWVYKEDVPPKLTQEWGQTVITGSGLQENYVP